MKRITMALGVGLVAMTALVAPSLASATGTALCSKAEEHCAAGNRYPVGTSVTATPVSQMTFTTPIASSSCTSSNLGGQVERNSGGSEYVRFLFSSLSFSSCTNSTTVEVKNLPWIADVLPGKFAGEGSLWTPAFVPRLRIVRFGISCVYSTEIGAAISGTQLTLNAAKLVVASGSSGLCGEEGATTGSWSGAYSFTSPSPFFISFG